LQTGISTSPRATGGAIAFAALAAETYFASDSFLLCRPKSRAIAHDSGLFYHRREFRSACKKWRSVFKIRFARILLRRLFREIIGAEFCHSSAPEFSLTALPEAGVISLSYSGFNAAVLRCRGGRDALKLVVPQTDRTLMA